MKLIIFYKMYDQFYVNSQATQISIEYNTMRIFQWTKNKNGKTKNLFSCQLLLQLFLKTVSTHFLRNTAAFIFCDLIFFKKLLGALSYLCYFSTFVTIIKSSNESLSFSRPMNQLQKPPTSIWHWHLKGGH